MRKHPKEFLLEVDLINALDLALYVLRDTRLSDAFCHELGLNYNQTDELHATLERWDRSDRSPEFLPVRTNADGHDI